MIWRALLLFSSRVQNQEADRAGVVTDGVFAKAPIPADDIGASDFLQKIEKDKADLEKVRIPVDDGMAELSPELDGPAHASKLSPCCVSVATHAGMCALYSLAAGTPSSFNRAATSAPAVFVSTLLSIWRILPSASM